MRLIVEMKIKNNQLIEELAVILIADHKLTPLGAKIYALLIIADDELYTFDDIVDMTDASKSSVSNQLNHLLDNNKIVYETKPNSRKRFFKTNDNYLNKMLTKEYEHADEHINILNKLIKSKKENQMAKVLKEHYKHAARNIESTLEKINQIQNTQNK